MKLDIKSSLAKITPILNKIKEYSSFAFVLIALAVFAFLVLRIRTLVTAEPSQSAIDERLLVSQPVRIDPEAIERVEKLEESNIEVKALFKQARDNPFEE